MTKQDRYKSSSNRDLIDEWSDNYSTLEFRAIMNGNIQKYSRRYGKKDDPLKEARKIQDYVNRLVEYEEQLLIDSTAVHTNSTRNVNPHRSK